MMPPKRIYFHGKRLESRRLKVEAGEPGLHAIRDFVLQACREVKFKPQEAHNLRLAVDEAASNVYRHAYQRQPGSIEIVITFYRRCLCVELIDQGKAFNWKGARTPDLNQYVADRKKGGLGIWFIRKLTDASNYESGPKGNRLVLWKMLPTEALAERALVPWGARKQSLQIVFVLRAVVFLGALTILIFGYGAFRVQRSLRARFMENAVSTAQNMAASSLDDLYKEHDLLLSDLAKDVLEHDRSLGYAIIVNAKGQILGTGDLKQLFAHYSPPPGVGKAQRQVNVTPWKDVKSGETFFDINLAIMDGARCFGEVHVGLRRSAIRQAVTREFWGLLVVLILILGVGAAGSWVLIKVIISPIKLLTEGVVAIGEGKLDHRIELPGNDEFGQIAKAFNEMAYKFSGAQKSLVEQEAMKKELQVAKVIQETLLPKELPQIQGYDVSSTYRSAKDVGGDYYDFIDVDRKRLGICVADVSGKGVPGSLVMTMIRTCIRLEARANPSPSKVLVQVNDVVTSDMKRGMFVTLFYLVLDSYKREIRYACAGHDPLVLFRAATRKTYLLKPKGFPLGISLPDPKQFNHALKEEKIHLAKGDILVTYTDGIIEAMNAKREQFGMPRFLQLIRDNSHLASSQFVDKLNQEIQEFTGDYPQNDDITLVAIKEELSQLEVQQEVRQKLIDFIEVQKMSVAEACRRLKLTPATWYYFKKQRKQLGNQEALKGRAVVKEELKLVSLEERELLYPLIAAHPEWEGRELAKELAQITQGASVLEAAVVQEDLQRLKLGSAEQRQRFAQKWTSQKAEGPLALPVSASQPVLAAPLKATS